MTVVVSGDPSGPLSSRSTSRSKASGMRFSSTKVRGAGGSSHGGAGTSTLGGHPMTSADPSSSKMDIKHRFEITAKLGSGTYGKVSLAFDHKMEREVAVKLIKKSAIENKQDLVRIRREIRIMSMLKHPNIIQIYEVFENKDKIILVMEYANGGELYDYVSKFGSLPETEARRIFRQITSAVLYCHKHKVAHRDLKLENILLDSSNNAKIADFGLSNYFNEKNLLTTFCGSPLYASPEIINGTPYKGPEVDCWSLGILLYTLVYGSMPFDGRDFNRMVRQIKRGAYYEPDTPSTASMLVRNMLRVNPDRRADIDDIASHWWLNLEENMPVIQELPENQIIDHTPLTERAEIMVVQDLADETDVFMEFGHLSASTRQKIEEFRRRRKEAEEYNESSPIKPPKTRKTSNAKEALPELTSKEKSLRHQEEPTKVAATSIIPSSALATEPIKKEKNAFQDPLERLRQLENRLQGGKQAERSSPEPSSPKHTSSRRGSAAKAERKLSQDSKDKEGITYKGSVKSNKKAKEEPEKPTSIQAKVDTRKDSTGDGPAFVSATEATEARNSHSGSSQKSGPLAAVAAAVTSRRTSNPQQYWRLETDSLNVLMNQVLEQMEKGQVSMNLVGRIKAHPFYDERPMVKELLESIISAQPPSVQQEASKLIQQHQTQDLARRQTSSKTITESTNKALPDVVPDTPKTPTKASKPNSKYQVAQLPSDIEAKKAALKKTILDERPWHSVEVGFSTDSDTSSNYTEGETTKATAQAPKFIGTRVTRSAPFEDEEEDDDEFYDAEEDEEEEYESDIDELAQVVENVTKSSRRVAAAPTIVENLAEPQTPKSPNQPADVNHLSTLERGLAKRMQSKGKYQFLHNHVEMYGRGVSMEAESPPVKRRIGGPQPKPEHSPILFDKAKNYLMNYPDKINDSDDDVLSKKKLKSKQKSDPKKWLRSQDPDVPLDKSNTVTPTPTTRGSVPPRTPPTIKSDEEDSEEEEEEEEEEESEEEGAPFRPRPSTIIGFRTIQPIGSDGVRKEAPIVQVKPQTSQSALSSSVKKANGPSTPKSPTAKAVIKEVKQPKDQRETIKKIAEKQQEVAVSPKKSSPVETAILRRKSSLSGTSKPNVMDSKSNEGNNDSNMSPVLGYHRPSYLDERKHQPYESNYSRQTYVDRRKSFQEMTPNRDSIEERCLSPFSSAAMYERYGIGNLGLASDVMGAFGGPLPTTNVSRYEDEVYNAFYPTSSANNSSWNNEPHQRFEVYRTRAERAADYNTANFAYRHGATSHLGREENHRPASVYVPGSSYKSRYETSENPTAATNNYTSYHRRSFYDDRATTPNNDPFPTSAAGLYTPSTAAAIAAAIGPPESPSGISKEGGLFSRFKPVTRRLGSALRDVDGRRARARSQSNDHMFRDVEAELQLNPRLMTPDMGGGERFEYGYVNYHDSGRGAPRAMGAEPDPSMIPARSILKNKQAYEVEPRENPTALTERTQVPPLSSTEPKSKKSFLNNLARRRTAEIRMLPDGKISSSTNSYLDDDYKRPRSPIDRIKSLFRGKNNSVKDVNALTNTTSYTPSTASNYSNYTPLGSGSTRFSSNSEKNYAGASSYQPNTFTQSPNTQTKRYSGAATSVNLNRFGYVDPSTRARASPRNWYDDPHLF